MPLRGIVGDNEIYAFDLVYGRQSSRHILYVDALFFLSDW